MARHLKVWAGGSGWVTEELHGFRGLEDLGSIGLGGIGQVVVSALYAAHAQECELTTTHLLQEIHQTRPLSVVMAEQVQALHVWAAQRTVPRG